MPFLLSKNFKDPTQVSFLKISSRVSVSCRSIYPFLRDRHTLRFAKEQAAEMHPAMREFQEILG